MRNLSLTLIFLWILTGCNSEENSYQSIPTTESYPNVTATFGSKLDLNNLYNYANQSVPNYIVKNNTGSNLITNKGATLGRVLFYDKKLSSNNTIACESCHQQNNAFGDFRDVSIGINGSTDRHSMRLVNNRFAVESKFFWDERATSLEFQTTQPIRNHIEMGYSGTNGDQSFDGLITKLNSIPYYSELFKFVYGNEEITEVKIQSALAQFVKSIQSFDSKYDIGRSQVTNDAQPFPNFTAQENNGKNLFLTPPVLMQLAIELTVD